MTSVSRRFRLLLGFGLISVTAAMLWGAAQPASGSVQAHRFQGSNPSPASAERMNPAELAALLRSPKSAKPLLLYVGPRLLYVQAHIPGSEYIGAGSDPQGLQALQSRVKNLPKTKFIVIYCGCCPWSHCPNIAPAYQELKKLGFTRVKALYIANNLGADWVYQGYPTAKGQ